jgi:hypothetical protein
MAGIRRNYAPGPQSIQPFTASGPSRNLALTSLRAAIFGVSVKILSFGRQKNVHHTDLNKVISGKIDGAYQGTF